MLLASDLMSPLFNPSNNLLHNAVQFVVKILLTLQTNMAKEISVVIICKNAAETISDVVASALQVTGDVLVADSGSADGSLHLAADAGANTISIEWKGYSAARNEAAVYAKYNWIFSLDADEIISPELAAAVLKTDFVKGNVYGMRRRNYLNRKEIKHGEWGKDIVYRIYHSQETKWNQSEVHEEIETGHLQKKLIGGTLQHYTAKNMNEVNKKLMHYARLRTGKGLKKSLPLVGAKMIFSPPVNFIQNYFLKQGFRDGKEGWQLAMANAAYTFNKYRFPFIAKLKKRNEDK